jgi:hypothetical protein
MMYWYGLSCYVIGAYVGYIISDIFHYDKHIKLRNEIRDKDLRIKFLEDEVKDSKNQEV